MAGERDRKARAKKYALAVRAVLEGRIGITEARIRYHVHSLSLLNKLKAKGYVPKKPWKTPKCMLDAVRAVVSGELSRASAARKFGVNYDVLEGKIYDFRNGALKMSEKSPRKTTAVTSSPRSSKRVKQKENSPRDHLPSTSHASPSKRSSMTTPLPTALVSSNQMPARPQKLIESILEVRTVRQYLIKWKNVPATGNTWELMENVNARIKNTNIVIPPVEDLIKTGNGSSTPYIPLPTVASAKRKVAEVRECSPEILPPPKRASVALSKSSGFSPAPSTPSIPLESPVGEIEEQAPEFPEASPEPPLVSIVKPVSKESDTVYIPDKAWKKQQTDEQNKTKQENDSRLNKTEFSDEVFEGDETTHSDESDTDASEENAQTEPDVIYISDSPISEDAELFGEAEDVKPEIKVESRMEIKQSPGENQEKDSFEVLMSELDNEDAISVDRLETAILSDGDLSWTGAIADTASPMKSMSEVRKEEMPVTSSSSIQERLERCLSPRKKEQSPASPTPVLMPSPAKAETEPCRRSKLDALLTSNNGQKPKEVEKPLSVEEIKEVVGASLEDDVFRIRIKWIQKDTRKVRAGWVEEDVYQEWDAPLQEMIKNFFMKYGMPSSDRPEIRAGRSDEEERTTIWSV